MFGILITIFFILFAVFAWRRLEWAIYAVIVALPAYLIRFELFYIPMTLLEGMILIVFATWLIQRIKIKELRLKNLGNNFIIPIGLFFIAATISVFVSSDVRAALGIWKAYIIEPILFFIVILSTIKTQKQTVQLFWAIAAAIIIPGLLAIYQKFTGAFIPNELWADAATRRVTSVYGYPNAIGLFFAPVLTGAIAMIVHKIAELFRKRLPEKEKEKLVIKLSLFSIIALIAGLGILFAQSKGAVLGVLIGILFYALFWKGNRLIFGAVLIVLALAAITQPSLRTLVGEAQVAGGGSLEVRTAQWQETWQMLKTRPLQGAGLAGYQTRIMPFHTNDHIEIFLYPHQIMLNFWSEMGLLGLIAFIWIVVLFFVYTHDVYQQTEPEQRHLPKAIAGGMVTILAHGLVDVPYFKNDLAVMFWLMIAIMIIFDQLSREGKLSIREKI